MQQPLLVSVVLTAVSLVMWLVGWTYGKAVGLALAVVITAPLIAWALTQMFTAGLGASVRAVKEVAYRDVHGQYFEYKGHPLKIQQDDDGQRWIRLQDIRAVISALPRDEVMLRMQQHAVGRPQGARELFIEATALHRYLERHQSDPAIRFRNWLQREVVAPAQRAAQAHADH